jgi:hypothetical protein
LLAGSGWNWFSCVAGGVLTSWSHGKWRMECAMDRLIYGIMFSYVLFWNKLPVLVIYIYIYIYVTNKSSLYTLVILPIFKISIWHIPIVVYTVLDPWWQTENLSKTCRILFQK